MGGGGSNGGRSEMEDIGIKSEEIKSSDIVLGPLKPEIFMPLQLVYGRDYRDEEPIHVVSSVSHMKYSPGHEARIISPKESYQLYLLTYSRDSNDSYIEKIVPKVLEDLGNIFRRFLKELDEDYKSLRGESLLNHGNFEQALFHGIDSIRRRNFRDNLFFWRGRLLERMEDNLVELRDFYESCKELVSGKENWEILLVPEAGKIVEDFEKRKREVESFIVDQGLRGDYTPSYGELVGLRVELRKAYRYFVNDKGLIKPVKVDDYLIITNHETSDEKEG